MAEPEADVGEEVDEMEAEKKLKLSKRWLFGFFAVPLIPGTVLAVKGFLYINDCMNELQQCEDECTRTFADPTRIFASEFARERACKDDCRLQADDCTNRANGVLMGAVVLGVSVLCAMAVYNAFEGIMKDFVRSLTSVSVRPRAAYHEPVETEEEQRRKLTDNSWYGKSPVFSVTEAWCLNCDIGVEVDLKWMTCEQGGRHGAVCPRCRKTILGVL